MEEEPMEELEAFGEAIDAAEDTAEAAEAAEADLGMPQLQLGALDPTEGSGGGQWRRGEEVGVVDRHGASQAFVFEPLSAAGRPPAQPPGTGARALGL